uniref:acyl-CoA dehydrogenase family protein n=1 Tax=Burkholderia sp. Ac-20379 TaxID=2703900 RepID=UPI00197E69D4
MTPTTQIDAGWGAGPSERYEALIAPFRPIFARIRDGAVERERSHRLLFDELRWLRDAGFPRLRLPVEAGGFGASLPELFAALIELGEADPSVVNALRSHLGFTEEVLASAPSAWRDGWIARFAAGETTGSGFSELGDGVLGSAATRLSHDDGQRLLNGEKYYTSGSLYADWIHLSASDEAGAPVGLLVPVRAPGVEIVDDWDGFGQQLSASGTARFVDVAVDPLWLKPSASRFGFAPSFFQLVHLATLAGIARAATGDVARLVAERTRIYGGRTQARRVSEDPQVLEVVGKVRGAACVGGGTVDREGGVV